MNVFSKLFFQNIRMLFYKIKYTLMYSRPFLQTIEIGSIIYYMYILILPEQKFGIQSTLQNN